MSSIACTFDDFKRLAKEFHEAAPALDIDALDNAWKCLGLAYLGMCEGKWQHSAAMLLNMEGRLRMECESALMHRGVLCGAAPVFERTPAPAREI